MSKLWVIVADQSKARIFTVADPRGALLRVGELEHPEARDREQTLTSDRPGRSFDSKGQGRHAMGSTVEPGKQETIRFARQVADHLQAAHDEGRCDRLLLVAGPPLLGLLRESLRTSSGMEITEIEKNLGQFDALEIRKHLPGRL
ncbi:MAG: host attachment protein [Gammaproteobacteria bacterium]|nr:host attachment protein [Gammaproteobacteria bacterium]